MKRKPLLITASCLFFLTLAYSLYTALQSKKPIQAWDLVPKDAILVYEGDFNQISRGGDSSLNSILQHFEKDSISGSYLFREELLGKKSLVSLHLTQREGFDLVTYIPLSENQKNRFNKFLSTKKEAKTRSRIFEGSEIIEFAIAKSKVVSIVFIGKVLVISNTPFLVEDVIRKSISEVEGFRESNSVLYSLARIESDNGNLYIDLKKLTDFQNLFLSKKSASTVARYLGSAMLIDLKVKDRSILMNGFALDSISSKPSVLSMFNGQRPVSFDLKSILPLRAGLVAHYGISDFSQWTESRSTFCKFHRKSILDSLHRLEKHYGITQEKLGKAIGDEVAQFMLSDIDNSLFAIEIRNKSLLISMLENLNSGLSKDVNYQETYSGYQIRKSKLPQLVHTLFWPLTEQTNFNFYAICDKYLVLSTELDELKSFLDDVEAEATWNKSTDWNKFLESTAQETNVSFFFSDAFFPLLKDNLTKSWSSYSDSVNFHDVSKGAFQLSRLDENYYFNGTLSFLPGKKSVTTPRRNPNLILSLNNPVKSRFYQVKNHLNGTSEILVQDSENNLFLVSNELKILWTKKIESEIKGEITQIDFYKNRKLQYFFVTDNHLHVVDRLGKYVKGFPKKVNTGVTAFSSLVDYDNSKNYRFIIGNSLGKLFMYNKEGEALPGWQPNGRSKKLILSLQHFKILGKDYLISVDENGAIYSFTRKGEVRENFPVEVGLKSYNGLLHKAKANDEFFYGLSADGKLIRFDLSGKIIEITTLIKSSVDSKFTIATDLSKNSSVICRADKEKIAVFDFSGAILFEIANPGSEKIILTYFDLAPKTQVYCFWDSQQEFAYLYDQSGKLISGRPFESSVSPVVIHDRNDKKIVYSIYKNRLIQTLF